MSTFNRRQVCSACVAAHFAVLLTQQAVEAAGQTDGACYGFTPVADEGCYCRRNRRVSFWPNGLALGTQNLLIVGSNPRVCMDHDTNLM